MAWKNLSVALFAALLAVPHAAAYLDPGTGAMLWQVLVSAFLGIVFTIKLFWRRIKAFFARVFGRSPASSTGASRAAISPRGTADGADAADSRETPDLRE